jgi:glutamate synthase domain-containing protein 2/glutamate synthase domain-containing protein 1/glutamate synthase domain-containing protein 3
MLDPYPRGRASCGVGFIADLSGTPTHLCVQRGVECLVNMDHRGAEGADEKTGDGAGILMQLPDRLLRSHWEGLPEPGHYGVAVCFLPHDPVRRAALEGVLEASCERRGLRVVGWRDVPVDPSCLGEVARGCMPVIRQLAVAADRFDGDAEALERRLYVTRRLAEKSAGGDDLQIMSFSARTIVYKGMLRAIQLEEFFPDLVDERTESALALMHSRFSTNTFPSWELAHPYRMVAHNGEVNTLAGNRNWMRAREGAMRSELLGDELAAVLPVIDPHASDSASIDAVVELLVRAGRSAPHALKLMAPEALPGREGVTAAERGFVDFHSLLMEPWDGPAAIAYCDGKSVGATLDRNGLRPGRWLETRDGWDVCASEAGTVAIDPGDVVRRGRLEPGTILVADVVAHELLVDREVEKRLAAKRDYAAWHAERTLPFDQVPAAPLPPTPELDLGERQRAFGYSQEDLRVLIGPLAAAGKEPTGSMGADAALAALSDKSPSLFSYFKQRFAQVTNPAIDPVREEVVMSLRVALGRHGDLLTDGPGESFCLLLERPVLADAELARIRALDHPVLHSETLDATWPREDGASGLAAALERLCAAAVDAVDDGATILIVSDRACSPERIPIPALLATAAVHHRLVRAGRRLRTALVSETGEARETHHIACLVGFGAEAVNPYLMIESARALLDEDPEPAIVKALDAGLLKVLSKLGISTVSSYRGAQAFEAIGLDHEFIESWFTGTPSRLGGIGVEGVAREALVRHGRAWPGGEWPLLPVGGVYAWRRDGERHGWNPESVALLQKAARGENGDGHEAYEAFRDRVDAEQRGLTLRGLLRPRADREAVPLREVEPAAEIVKRFATGAMSLGSLSPESHETLAVAMNRLGGRSNTGEGGEDPRRYVVRPNGDSRRSAIKQVASGRFGVTIGYLMEADQIQIKVAQGAKPGEGGQLPGSKVDRYIGELRFATPGVELISPPPHHDIYSIEDLKQLIYDLRCANPKAEISVKLAAEVGVGTVAAGVVKAGADHVVVVGHDGGTGASPTSSIQAAGIPWELGMAETQQVLVEQGLRGRVVLQTDGGMRTGRDVVVAGLLGAEEVAFSTAPLIATGCIMMRVCHLNTCPVGIATQDPELRARFAGTPEHVVNYLMHVAEDVRGWMASLGVRSFEELIGQVELLERDPAVTGGKAARIDLTEVLHEPRADAGAPRRKVEPGPGAPTTLDQDLIREAEPAIARREPVSIRRSIRNVDRTVGGMLSNAVVGAHGELGLLEGTIEVELVGSAGQSFGAWLAPGISLALRGEANDYAGKGLCGGLLAVSPFEAEAKEMTATQQVIVGNTVLYGATGGRAFFRGLAGERFAVRNSGASAVVEGVGDHGCEYMTGGRVVVLGRTGRNFAAGMSGGIAYVLDPEEHFERCCNRALVDLEPLSDRDEAEEVRLLVAEHARRTGSPLALELLNDWAARLPEFTKVMPRDYRRALEAHFAEETAEREAAAGAAAAAKATEAAA